MLGRRKLQREHQLQHEHSMLLSRFVYADVLQCCSAAEPLLQSDLLGFKQAAASGFIL